MNGIIDCYDHMLRFIANLFLAATGAIVALVCAFLGVVAVQMAIHGERAFEHDAGANFALFIIGSAVALPVAVAVFGVLFYLFQYRYGLWKSNRACSKAVE
jgi:hypothetical protein